MCIECLSETRSLYKKLELWFSDDDDRTEFMTMIQNPDMMFLITTNFNNGLILLRTESGEWVGPRAYLQYEKDGKHYDVFGNESKSAQDYVDGLVPDQYGDYDDDDTDEHECTRLELPVDNITFSTELDKQRRNPDGTYTIELSDLRPDKIISYTITTPLPRLMERIAVACTYASAVILSLQPCLPLRSPNK